MATTSSTEAELAQVLLWFPEKDGRFVTTEARDIPPSARGVLAELGRGPDSPGVEAPFASGAVRELTVSAGSATVTFSPALTALSRQAVARSLLGIEDIAAVTIDGSPEMAASDLVAPITISEPVPGSRVNGVVSVSGTASVFEAALNARLLDADGRELASAFTTATEGAPGRGEYAADLEPAPVTRDTPATVEVFNRSAKDASVEFSRKLPVTLTAS